MAHTFTTTALSRLGREARRRDDPSYFLDRFGPMHRRWHSLSSNARPLGFLLYHWHVIQAFKIAGGPRFVGGGSMSPYTPANFAAFGWPYNVTAHASAGDVDSLANFSFEIEMWHNDAHMAIGMATDTPMMDPEENIWYLPFWRLHYFISHSERLRSTRASGHAPSPGPDRDRLVVSILLGILARNILDCSLRSRPCSARRSC